MNDKKVNEIMDKIIAEWKKRIPKGAVLDEEQLIIIKKVLEECPDEDGCKRVQSFETGKVHLVPIEKIILDGLKGTELHNYPVEKEVKGSGKL